MKGTWNALVSSVNEEECVKGGRCFQGAGPMKAKACTLARDLHDRDHAGQVSIADEEKWQIICRPMMVLFTCDIEVLQTEH